MESISRHFETINVCWQPGKQIIPECFASIHSTFIPICVVLCEPKLWGNHTKQPKTLNWGQWTFNKGFNLCSFGLPIEIERLVGLPNKKRQKNKLDTVLSMSRLKISPKQAHVDWPKPCLARKKGHLKKAPVSVSRGSEPPTWRPFASFCLNHPGKTLWWTSSHGDVPKNICGCSLNFSQATKASNGRGPPKPAPPTQEPAPIKLGLEGSRIRGSTPVVF